VASRFLRPLTATLRALAALVGTLPLAVLSSVCLARFAPFAEGTRFLLGASLVAPLWILTMCLAFLTRAPWRFWGVCGVLCAVQGALAYAV
jgi:hypothetical protein